MHGLGNDFIIASGEELKGSHAGEAAIALCDRNRGIGGDGLLFYSVSHDSAVTMSLFNSDGSEAEMCGNGIRCLARFVYEEKLVPSREFSISTRAGLKHVRLFPGPGSSFEVDVDMGAPRLLRKEIPVTGAGTSRFVEEKFSTEGKEYTATCVNMGNPHCVIFVDTLESISLRKEGMAIEHAQLFPSRTNVEFVRATGKDLLQVKVWERGAGETLACGTGACASLVAASLTGRTGRSAKVTLPGGALTIEWKENDSVFMRGPAERVFEGECDLNALIKCISLTP
jgi:diaminopimelate epimerase